MGRLSAVSIVHRRALNQALLYTKNAPTQVLHKPRTYLRALRAALCMSQTHLSKRSGVSQARIAKIEAGVGELQLGTLQRLFDAMYCDLLVLPKARKRPSDALAEREVQRLVGQGPWDNPPTGVKKRETALERLWW